MRVAGPLFEESCGLWAREWKQSEPRHSWRVDFWKTKKLQVTRRATFYFVSKIGLIMSFHFLHLGFNDFVYSWFILWRGQLLTDGVGTSGNNELEWMR
jgi:hypothetical protein